MFDILQPFACERLCSRLCVDFAHFVDSREYEKLAALFVDDGTFERRGEVLRGREAILLAMRARPGDLVTRHICTNIRIDSQNGGTANGVCSLLLFHGHPNDKAGPALTIAQYRDAYVVTAQGWRIRERVADLVFDS